MKKVVLLFLLLVCQISLAQIVNIPDANFKAALIEEGVDTNGDGEIQVSEAESVTSLSVRNLDINSLEGIGSFTNLTSLDCGWNNLTSLDLSNNTLLESLTCHHNDLTALDLSNTTKLTNLICTHNPIGSLDVTMLSDLVNLECYNMGLNSLQVSGLSKLENLEAQNNFLSQIDLTGLISLELLLMNSNEFTSNSDMVGLENLVSLEELFLGRNSLTSLDVSTLTNLKLLLVLDNQISALNVSGNIHLETLRVEDNQLISLDLSHMSNLRTINTHNNPIETLFLKNGSSETDITLGLSMEYVCVDPEDVERIQNIAPNNCVVNSFCTFEPGGEVYYVQGNVKVDIDQDGCDSDDIGFPFIQLRVEDSNGDWSIYGSELDGSYHIPLPEGDYTIDYQFPYMSYFDIAPSSFSVDFPADTSPFEQDICLTPNGNYNDLQIAIIPLDEARPGFDANYKIIYTNVGTNVLSGDVTFNFDDNVMDFISASTNPDTQNTGELSWSFTNLAPLEFKTIDVVMNLNAPTETPPLNGGEILCYETVITPLTNDEVVSDNSFSLKQTVVNSYDPNDKTCLEGDVITPDLVGEYVHYLIRFENTGTASAINVVVKDIIDTNKFDMESFVPMNSSHDFVTRIQNGNEVEFIFEGINLPFDDATNDGYVLFKIKTLSTLEVGDTFENSAEIYFDFNFPIITNVEQTTIDNAASNDDFALNARVKVFPSPAEGQLQIESQRAFDTLIVYDLTGKELKRIVSTESRFNQEIDVSNLKSGIYYLSILSGNSKTTQKFLKR